MHRPWPRQRWGWPWVSPAPTLPLETADLVLVRDELKLLPYAVRLSRKAQRIVRQNLAFACAVIAILVVVNLLHGLALPIGVVGPRGEHDPGGTEWAADCLRPLEDERPRGL